MPPSDSSSASMQRVDGAALCVTSRKIDRQNATNSGSTSTPRAVAAFGHDQLDELATTATEIEHGPTGLQQDVGDVGVAQQHLLARPAKPVGERKAGESGAELAHCDPLVMLR